MGALIWLLTLVAYKLFPIPSWSLAAAGAVGLLSALVGLMIGGWRKTSVVETARWVDGKQHLQERLSTALEMSKGKTGGTEAWREIARKPMPPRI